jgi:tRNA(Arg) A34 adenosine deaminase TadA
MEAFRAAGLQMSYGDTVMCATALPCWMCAGAIAWFRV